MLLNRAVSLITLVIGFVTRLRFNPNTSIKDIKDRVNFGSLGFIKTPKITKLPVKEEMNRYTVKLHFFRRVTYVLARKIACFMKT